MGRADHTLPDARAQRFSLQLPRTGRAGPRADRRAHADFGASRLWQVRARRLPHGHGAARGCPALRLRLPGRNGDGGARRSAAAIRPCGPGARQGLKSAPDRDRCAQGQAWLADWLATPASNAATARSRPCRPTDLQEVVRQNASSAGHEGLRNWVGFRLAAGLDRRRGRSLRAHAGMDAPRPLRLDLRRQCARIRSTWGQPRRRHIAGFDLTGILDSESERERMAVLSYLFRRVERVIEDRQAHHQSSSTRHGKPSTTPTLRSDSATGW